MKRVAAVLLGAFLVMVVGCGTQNYEARLERTLAARQYQKRLDDNLNAAPTKGRLEQLQIYVRPPKDMTGPTQTFQMTVIEPGRFDVESSFIEPEKQSLHLLGRVKQPTPANKKAQAPTQAAPRGDFGAEIVDLVRNVYGADIDINQFKEEKKKNNTFRTKRLDLAAKTVQVYLYGGKTNPYEVALIFEYLTAEKNAVDPKINLCLESFAVGEKAKRAFAGGDVDEEAGGGDETSQPVVF
jgi:hypothetical protein